MPSSILRVALFLVAYLLITWAAAVPKSMVPARFGDLTWGVVASLGLLALTRFVLAREQRDPQAVGIALDARSVWRLLAGVAMGVAVYSATFALISLTVGPIRLTAPTWPTARTWTVMLTSYLALSCMEELGFRAYALRTLASAIGPWRAQLGIVVAFGASHLLYGWSWSTIVFGVIPSAFLFGVVALRSGGLAMPIGLHAALNVTQWLVGAKDTLGIWTVSIDPAHAARVTTVAPWIGLGVSALATVVIARWPARQRPALVSATELR